jgi:enoyl-CoA hydratase/carnithine racemase
MRLPRTTDASLVVRDHVAVLTFERDDVRNALTGTALIEDIVTTVDWVNGAGDVSVLVMTGAGSAFSAGGNIKEMKERQGSFAGDVPEVEERYRRGIQRIPLALEAAEVPVIAAVNGPAIGAGCDLACMCDLRIGSARATFGETFLNLGLIPGDGGAWFLQRLVGYQRAAELTFTGRLLGAAEAEAIGLLLEVVEPEALMVRVRELAATIAAKPPGALRYAKRLLKIAQRSSLGDCLAFSALVQGVCHNTAAHREAVEAVFARQPGRTSPIRETRTDG